ncbi:hypothetical protein [Gracilimonas tropica]|uniref:hypothetical protein n=1 Tax=Gracilimonas tropica TaxID=454600 RepID=UPI00037E0B09|nr:hypothetical protein [Gracilimonas tropica]
MGREFKTELSEIDKTLVEALEIDISILKKALSENIREDLLIVGSGGSFSVAKLISTCHNDIGGNAEAVTPLMLLERKDQIINKVVVLISASGRNNDILFATKLAMIAQSKKILALTLTGENKLAEKIKPYTRSKHISYNFSYGKDGFLSVNSLVAYFTIILRAYSDFHDANYILKKDKFLKSKLVLEVENFANKIDEKVETISLLYSAKYEAIATDLESKLVEAGLFNPQISDVRNFAHGRHNWFDKKKNNTVLLSIISGQDLAIAKKTIKEIPDSIPKLLLNPGENRVDENLYLLKPLFHLVNLLGEKRGIDPGRPGIPKFGRKIYNLAFQSQYLKEFNRVKVDEVKLKKKEVYALQNKLNVVDLNSLKSSILKYWYNNYKEYLNKIRSTKFKAIVFDYDETLCSSQRRYLGPSESMKNYLNKILDNDLIVGVATGRGKSVHNDLKKIINEEYQDRVLIAYYNGSIIGKLSDGIPNIKIKTYANLAKLKDQISLIPEIDEYLLFKLRPTQLSINLKYKKNSEWVIGLIQDSIRKFDDLKMVWSSHSIDIIPKEVSKLSIINRLNTISSENEILMLGDQGKYPGNDFDLLNSKYSLSVDDTNSITDRCWYLADGYVKGVDATHYYLDRIKYYSGYFKIKL